MLGSFKIAAFVAASDAEKAKEFYGEKLGLELIDEDPYALVYAVADTTLRIQKGLIFTPQQFTVLGWHVPDIESKIKELRERGIQFERYEGFGQDDLGIMTFPNGAKVAWFKDPDGNVLSLDNQ